MREKKKPQGHKSGQMTPPFKKTLALNFGRKFFNFSPVTLFDPFSDASETPAVDDAFLRADNEPRRPER